MLGVRVGVLDRPPAPARRGAACGAHPVEGRSMTSATSTGQRVSPWATGLIAFAGAIMVVAGIWQVFSGTAALTHAAIYDGAPRYVYAFDLTAWGWIQLL